MCGETIAKIILIVLNVTFFLGGGAVMAVGIVALVKAEYIYKLTAFLSGSLSNVVGDLKVLTSLDLNGLITSNAIIFIVVGGFLFILGFLGCCGAMRKSSCMLNLYAVLVLIILACEVGLGVYAYMYSDKLEAQIQDGLKLSVYKYYKEGIRFDNNNLVIPTEGEELAWDSVQIETGCCGISNYSDWASAAKWNTTYEYGTSVLVAKLPPSCCKRNATSVSKEINQITADDFVDMKKCMESAAAGTYNDVACYDRIKDILFENKKLVIAIFVIVVLVEILAISCACWLKHQAEKK